MVGELGGCLQVATREQLGRLVPWARDGTDYYKNSTYSTKKPLFLSAAGVLDLLERGTISA
jgi:hypothetical protein